MTIPKRSNNQEQYVYVTNFLNRSFLANPEKGRFLGYRYITAFSVSPLSKDKTADK